MTFGEKVLDLRKNKLKVSQTELAVMCGVSLRTVRGWEVDGRYPKSRETYARLAQVLEVDEAYLRGETELERDPAALRDDGQRSVSELIRGARLLFAGGSISEDDKDELMLSLQDAYVRAKRKRRALGTDGGDADGAEG